MSKEIAAVLQELSARFGTTVENLWGALIRQSLIAGVTDVIVIAVWGIALWRAWTVHNSHEYRDSDHQACIGVGLFGATALTLIIVGFSASTIVGSLFNPEYWAIQKILSGGK